MNINVFLKLLCSDSESLAPYSFRGLFVTDEDEDIEIMREESVGETKKGNREREKERELGRN